MTGDWNRDSDVDRFGLFIGATSLVILVEIKDQEDPVMPVCQGSTKDLFAGRSTTNEYLRGHGNTINIPQMSCASVHLG
jgi:hypothetical protein